MSINTIYKNSHILLVTIQTFAQVSTTRHVFCVVFNDGIIEVPIFLVVQFISESLSKLDWHAFGLFRVN